MKVIEPNRCPSTLAQGTLRATEGWLLAREISQLAGVSPRAVQKFARNAPAEGKQEVSVRGGRAWRLLVSALPARWRARMPSQISNLKSPDLGGGPTGEGVAPVAAHSVGALPAANVSPAPAGAEASPDSAGGAARESQGGGPSSPGNAAALVLPSRSALERLGQLSLLGPEPPQGTSIEDWQEAMRRFHLLEPCVNGDWGRSLARTKSEFLELHARNAGVAPRTLWNWRKRFLQGGLPALAPRARSDQGVPKKPLPVPAQEALRAWRLRGYSIQACWEELGRQEIRDGLSLNRVQRFLRGLPRPALVRAFDGRQRFETSQLPYIRLKHDDYQPMELVAVDHTQLDNPVNYFGRACFPWLTFIIDWHSRYPVGFWLAETPSSRTLANAFRLSWLLHGVSDEVLTDRGKDMRSRYFAGLSLRLGRISKPSLRAQTPEAEAARGILHSAGVKEIRYTLGEHPQTKGVIERFFRTLKDDFCARFPAYRGRGPRQRGESVDALIAEHEANPADSPLVGITAYAQLLFAWFYDDYANREHRGCGMRGRTPAEAFRPRPPLLEFQANLILFKRETRVIQRGGVEIHGERYDSYALVEDGHNGHAAAVAWDPDGRLLPEFSEVLVTCCGKTYRVPWARALSMRQGVDDAEIARRLEQRARFLQRIERQIHRHQQASPDPLRRRLALLAENTPSMEPAVAPADPRYGRPPAEAAEGPASPFLNDRLDYLKKALEEKA